MSYSTLLLLLFLSSGTASLPPECDTLWIYHRIQKSGSTCIAEALERALQRCGSSFYVTFELQRHPDGSFRDTDVEADAARLYTPWTALLHGHFYYGIHTHLPLQGKPLLYVISMMEPVQRMISHYNYRKRIGLLHPHLGVPSRADVTWSLFLSVPAIAMCNEMTAVLAGSSRLHMTCDNYTSTDYRLLQRARETLQQYRLIMMREHMSESWQMLHNLLPSFPTRPRCAWDNSSGKPKEQPNRAEQLQLRRATLLDRILYRHAHDLFLQQARQLSVSIP